MTFQAVNSVIQDAPEQEQVIDLRKSFQVILSAKWRIMLFAFLMSAIAALVALSMDKIYRATSTLLIEAQQAQAIKIEEVYGFNSMQREYYLTQFEILKSREVAQRVFSQLNLREHPEFQSQPSLISQSIEDIKELLPFIPKAEVISPELAEEREKVIVLNEFISRVSIAPVRRTQLVHISFEAKDPALAAQVANEIGRAYIDSQLDATAGITQNANEWLSDRLEQLRKNLSEAEFRLEGFRKANNLVDVEGVTSLDARELEMLTDQITVARSEKSKIDALWALLNRYRNQPDRLQSLPEVTSHPSIQNVRRELIDVERKVSELEKVYGPKHPKMISANAELSSVQNQLSRQVTELVKGIEKDKDSIANNLQTLESRLGESREVFSGLSSVETQYRRLQTEVQTHRSLYDNFLERQKETEATSDFNAPVARFTDYAIKPINPVKPKRKLIVILVFVASIGMGIVVVLVYDALNDTIKSAKDVENLLRHRALGYLPKLPKKYSDKQKASAFFDQDTKAFSEAARSIRTSLTLMAFDKTMKTLAITSSVPAEGKSTASITIAFTFSGLERVLLIDADMRKPTVASRLDLPPYQTGLADYLGNTETLINCIVKDVKGIDVMPAGAIPLNPLELLTNDRFTKLLAELAGQYDKIIIDTPPIHAVSDALVISTKVDAVSVVVKADTTRSPLIQQSLAKLHQVHAKVYGVIINQLDAKAGQGEYGVDYGYYQVYEQSKKAS